MLGRRSMIDAAPNVTEARDRRCGFTELFGCADVARSRHVQPLFAGVYGVPRPADATRASRDEHVDEDDERPQTVAAGATLARRHVHAAHHRRHQL